MEKLKEFLNQNISVKYNGEEQILRDAEKRRVYPIRFDGTIYLPMRAVAEMLGVRIAWDRSSDTICIGENDIGEDFIAHLTPYDTASAEYRHITSVQDRPLRIAGKDCDHYIIPSGMAYYALDGQYRQLTFELYAGRGRRIRSVCFWGDDDRLLCEASAVECELPKAFAVDVCGVHRLLISGDSGCYLFHMHIR